jgi:hypothetical protein
MAGLSTPRPGQPSGPHRQICRRQRGRRTGEVLPRPRPRRTQLRPRLWHRGSGPPAHQLRYHPHDPHRGAHPYGPGLGSPPMGRAHAHWILRPSRRARARQDGRRVRQRHTGRSVPPCPDAEGQGRVCGSGRQRNPDATYASGHHAAPIRPKRDVWRPRTPCVARHQRTGTGGLLRSSSSPPGGPGRPRGAVLRSSGYFLEGLPTGVPGP